MKKTLVLGIGNTIRGDDGVGIEIVRELAELIDPKTAEIKKTSEAGFGLLDLVLGYKRLIIVDSIHTRNGKEGDICRFTLEDLKSSLHPQFSHNTGILQILAYGESMRLMVPEEIVVYTIEIEEINLYREGLNHKVKNTISKAVKLVEEEIRNHRDALTVS